MRLLPLALLLVCECGGSSPDTCSPPQGLYNYVFTSAVTNDPAYCPLPKDFAQVLPSNSPAPYGCATSASTGPHVSCSQSVEERCSVKTFDGYTGNVVAIITVDTNADSSVITGTVNETLVYAGGQGLCSAHWVYTATRVHQ